MKQRAAYLGHKGSAKGMILPYGLASLTVLFGVLGLFDELYVKQALGSGRNLLTLFGILLCTLVAVRFHRGLSWAAPISRSGIREVSRAMSRMVYMSLYVIIGLRKIAGLAEWYWHGETTSFEMGSDHTLQMLVVYGIVCLLVIRVLALGTWLYGARNAATIAE